MKRYVLYLNIKEVDVIDEDEYIHGVDGLFVLSSYNTNEEAQEAAVDVVSGHDARGFSEKSH